MCLGTDDGATVVGKGFEIVYNSGRPAHTGEIAQQMRYDADAGVLELTGIKYPTQPVQIRFYAVVNSTTTTEPTTTSSSPGDGDGGDGKTGHQLKRYRSDFYPINVQPTDDQPVPTWITRPQPRYDCEWNRSVTKFGCMHRLDGETIPTKTSGIFSVVIEEYFSMELWCFN